MPGKVVKALIGRPARYLDTPAGQGLDCAAMTATLPEAVREHLSRLASLGGKARAKKLSKRRRVEIAEKASRAAKRARSKRKAEQSDGASDA